MILMELQQEGWRLWVSGHKWTQIFSQQPVTLATMAIAPDLNNAF